MFKCNRVKVISFQRKINTQRMYLSTVLKKMYIVAAHPGFFKNIIIINIVLITFCTVICIMSMVGMSSKQFSLIHYELYYYTVAKMDNTGKIHRSRNANPVSISSTDSFSISATTITSTGLN